MPMRTGLTFSMWPLGDRKNRVLLHVRRQLSANSPVTSTKTLNRLRLTPRQYPRDCLQACRADLIFHNQELEEPDYYIEKNVFWAPALARWRMLRDSAKLPGAEIEITDGGVKVNCQKFPDLLAKVSGLEKKEEED